LFSKGFISLLILKNFTIERNGRVLLSNLNLSVKEGEKVLIIGPNGIGKTTLADAIMGFHPFKGSLYLFNKKIEKPKDFKFLRKKIGYVFQNPDDQLFMPTVLEELTFGPKNLGMDEEEISKRVKEVTEKLQIKKLLNKSILALSYGEKRLVSIACVLTMNPSYLILDEPTNGLDERSWLKIKDFLITSEKGLLVITHDKELIEILRKAHWKIVELTQFSYQ